MTINELAEEYKLKFGKYPPETFGASDKVLIEAMEDALKNGRPIPVDFNWFPDLPEDADV